MKKYSMCAGVALGLLSGCVTAHSTGGPASVMVESGADQALTAAAAIDKALISLGGADVVDRVRSLELNGNSRRTLVNGQEWSMLVTSYIAFPDRYRQEVIIPQARIVTVLNRDGAFIQTDAAGTIMLPPEERANILSGVQRNPVLLLQRRDNFLARLERPETVHGKPATVIRLEESPGTTHLVIDADSGEILQTRYVTSGAGNDKTSLMVVDYSDYRQVGSLRFPFRSEGYLGEKHAFTNELDGVAVNRTLPEHLFEAPGSPPSASAPTTPLP
jgi:hypothetical protein